MNNLTNVIIVGAAASFAALLFTRKNGPFSVLKWLRAYPPFNCLFCATFWMCLLFYGVFCYNADVRPDFIEFLATCGIGIYLSHGTYVESD